MRAANGIQAPAGDRGGKDPGERGRVGKKEKRGEEEKGEEEKEKKTRGALISPK